MLKKYRIAGSLIIGLGLASLLFAQTNVQFVDMQQVVQEFHQQLNALQQGTPLPVLFMQKIPVFGAQPPYYLSVERPDANHYRINVDATPNCKGAHYCNMGSLTVSAGENPQMYYGIKHQILTVPVTLMNGQTAYFTPSHAMGDYWPAQLEWRQGNLLYRLIWNVTGNVPEKEVLVTMANSISKTA